LPKPGSIRRRPNRCAPWRGQWIEASRADPGCGGYDYAFDLLEPDLMRVRELWKEKQALKDHFATPHMAAFLKGLRELRPKSLTVKMLRAWA
jgi:quinol monooxygenase YgiN